MKRKIMLNGLVNDDCPCKNCVVDRHAGCHSNCIKYIDWKQKHDVELQERREKVLISDAIWDSHNRRDKSLIERGAIKHGKHRNDSR